VSFNNIKGQDFVIDAFRNACRKERLAGAYIFTGPEGVGKLLFARELARYLFCRNRNEDSCGKCPSCRKIENDVHPDLFILETKETEQQIKIDYIRALQKRLYLKPLEAPKKVFVINDAHKMNEEASNCFLKSFEEPPADSIIILVTHNLAMILPTIQSRAVIVNFRPLDEETIEEILVQREGLGRENASFAAQLSGGSLSKARALVEGSFEPKRNWITEHLFSIRKENNFDLAEGLSNLCKTAGGVRQQLRDAVLDMLDMMTLSCRWMLAERIGKGKSRKSRARFMAPAGRIFSQNQLEKIIMELVNAGRYISLNANITITLENMFFRIGEIQGG